MIIPPKAYFFGEPRPAPLPGPAEFPICFTCNTPYVLRRTQGFYAPNQEIVEWRFFQDCKCKPARYKVINEAKDRSYGAQAVTWLVKLDAPGGWTVAQVPTEETPSPKKPPRKRTKPPKG